MGKLTLPRGIKPKVQLPDQRQHKADVSPDWMLDWRGKGGKFLLRGARRCCGSWKSSTGKSDGSGSSRGSGRLGSGGEVEGREGVHRLESRVVRGQEVGKDGKWGKWRIGKGSSTGKSGGQGSGSREGR